MKKLLGIVVLGLILVGNAYSETKFSKIKKALKEDSYGLAIPESFHSLNSPKAKNPVSVSDFAIIGKKSIRFESNHGECGFESNWSDCENDRERTELYYKTKSPKKEIWYKFYIYLPKDYNSVAPAKMSLIQFSIEDPFAVLVMFNQTHAGLTFNRHFALHGDSNENAYIVLKPNEELFGSWTEIIFNSNWHPDPIKGFMKVWIDGKLKIDFKGRSYGIGKKFSLRYGLYSSYLKNYRLTQGKEIHPQRIIYFDGIKAEKTCNKLLNKEICQSLTSQTVSKYIKFEHDGNNKKLYDKDLSIIDPSSFR